MRRQRRRRAGADARLQLRRERPAEVGVLRRDQQEHGALLDQQFLYVPRDAGHVHGRRGPAHEQGRRRAVGRRRQAVGAALDEGVRVDVRGADAVDGAARHGVAQDVDLRRGPEPRREGRRDGRRRPEQVRGELEREDRRAVPLHEGLDAVELEVARRRHGPGKRWCECRLRRPTGRGTGEAWPGLNGATPLVAP